MPVWLLSGRRRGRQEGRSTEEFWTGAQAGIQHAGRSEAKRRALGFGLWVAGGVGARSAGPVQRLYRMRARDMTKRRSREERVYYATPCSSRRRRALARGRPREETKCAGHSTLGRSRPSRPTGRPLFPRPASTTPPSNRSTASRAPGGADAAPPERPAEPRPVEGCRGEVRRAGLSRGCPPPPSPRTRRGPRQSSCTTGPARLEVWSRANGTKGGSPNGMQWRIRILRDIAKDSPKSEYPIHARREAHPGYGI